MAVAVSIKSRFKTVSVGALHCLQIHKPGGGGNPECVANQLWRSLVQGHVFPVAHNRERLVPPSASKCPIRQHTLEHKETSMSLYENITKNTHSQASQSS